MQQLCQKFVQEDVFNKFWQYMGFEVVLFLLVDGDKPVFFKYVRSHFY